MRSIFSFNKKRLDLDSLILCSGKNITFIICSIVSAFFNVFFISNIGGGGFLGIGTFVLKNAYLLILISIGLEMSKLYHVTLSNTTAEIMRKLDTKEYRKPSKDPVTGELGLSPYDRVESVHNKTKNVYLAYAVLAIIASLFTSFYIMISLRTDSVKSENQVQAIYDSFETIEKLEGQIKKLESERDEDKVYQKLNDEYVKPFNNVVNIFNKATQEEKEQNNWEGYWSVPKYQDLYGIRMAMKEIIGTSDGRTIAAKISMRDAKITAYYFSSIDKDIEKIEEKIKDEKASINKVCESVGETFNNKKDIDIYLADLQAKRERESGTTGVFVWIANNLFNGRINSSTLMAVFLFILSCMVELTIYQTSPKAKISRKVMYNFTQFMPKDFDINAFMDAVEKELIDYEIIKRTHNEERELDVAEMDLVKAETKAKINEAKKPRVKKQKTNLKAVQKILNNENDRDKELDKLMKKAKEVINE